MEGDQSTRENPWCPALHQSGYDTYRVHQNKRSRPRHLASDSLHTCLLHLHYQTVMQWLTLINCLFKKKKPKCTGRKRYFISLLLQKPGVSLFYIVTHGKKYYKQANGLTAHHTTMDMPHSITYKVTKVFIWCRCEHMNISTYLLTHACPLTM